MRNPTFILASGAAVIGVAAVVVAFVGVHHASTFSIIGIAALITAGATSRAVRACRA